MCIPLCRQPLRKLVDSIPPPPNWLGWYGDRECCAPGREIGGVRLAPINASGSATPAFFPGALDWRHRHQSPALVIDHLGDFHRRVVILRTWSHRKSVCAAILIPFETRLLTSGATQHPGADHPCRSNRLLSVARRARRLL
jgi:hypothetical protein